MEKKSYITSEWNMNTDRPRKIYKLTNGGKAALDYTTYSLNTICKTIATDNTQTHNGIQPQIQVIQHKPTPTEIY